MKRLASYFFRVCTRFTLLLFVLYALFLLLLDPAVSSRVIDFLHLIELFALACVLELIGRILLIKSLRTFAKSALQFCLTFFAFFTVFFLARGNISNLFAAILIVFFISIFYSAAEFALYLSAQKNRDKNQEETYTSIF